MECHRPKETLSLRSRLWAQKLPVVGTVNTCPATQVLFPPSKDFSVRPLVQSIVKSKWLAADRMSSTNLSLLGTRTSCQICLPQKRSIQMSTATTAGTLSIGLPARPTWFASSTSLGTRATVAEWLIKIWCLKAMQRWQRTSFLASTQCLKIPQIKESDSQLLSGQPSSQQTSADGVSCH